MTAMFYRAVRKIVYSVTPGIYLALFALTVYPATFPGTNTGAIPNGSGSATCGAPRDVQFAVTGIPTPVNSVILELTMAHGYIGDLDVALIAPNGTAFTIFKFVGRTSPTNLGSWSNLNGTYTFADIGSNGIWAGAAAGTGNGYDILPGIYRTQEAGPFATVNPGPPLTVLNSAFLSVPNATGTWTLRFLDCAGTGSGTETGSVTSANLTLSGLAPTSAGVTIAGQVRTSGGRAVSNTRIEMVGGEFVQPVFAITNGFGYFAFPDVPAGQTYILTVSSKQHVFADPTRVVNLDEDIFGVDFIAEPILFRR